MKLPTWFRIVWWVAITSLAGWLFSSRLPEISKTGGAPVDIVIFLVLVALLLAPVFQEVSFFGLKFKQAIDDLQKQISTQLSVLKADLQTTITNTSNVNVTVPSPPTDDQLPGLEERVRAAVTETMQSLGAAVGQVQNAGPTQVDEDTRYLFQVRYTIERKLRRISETLVDLSEKRSRAPIAYLTVHLVRQEVMPPNLGRAIRDVYDVCSPAIHGEPISAEQVTFVRDVAPGIIETLTEIERRTIG